MMPATLFDLGPTPAAPGLPGAPPTVATGVAAANFANALSAMSTGTGPAALTAGVLPERQAPAVSGKPAPVATPLIVGPDCELPDPDALPVIRAPDEGEADTATTDGEIPSDPALPPELVWLPPPVVVSMPLPVAKAGSAPQPVSVAQPAAPVLLGPDCEMPDTPIDPAPVRAGGSGPASSAGSAPATPEAPLPTATSRDIAPAGSSKAVPDAAIVPSRAGPDRAPITAPEVGIDPIRAAITHRAVPIDPGLAAKMAAPAIFALEPAGPNAPTAADAAILSATGSSSVNTVTGPSSAHHAGIDLTRDPGLHKMIDRIEQLRDAAGENGVRETRIRLIPDALGPVDIAVRREGAGDAVHVHFTATEAATRVLIAEAQQRLTELAETRGVRIERATIDGGGTGDGQARQSQQAQQQNRTPASANRERADEHPDTTDKRIA